MRPIRDLIQLGVKQIVVSGFFGRIGPLRCGYARTLK
jgi:hypothetical protein